MDRKPSPLLQERSSGGILLIMISSHCNTKANGREQTFAVLKAAANGPLRTSLNIVAELVQSEWTERFERGEFIDSSKSAHGFGKTFRRVMAKSRYL